MTREKRDDVTIAAMCAAALGVFFAACAWACFSIRAASSVTVGAAFAVANLFVMRAIVKTLVRPPEPEPDAEEPPADPENEEPTKKQSGLGWGVFGLFKIGILFGGLGLLLTKGIVDPIPLVVGYGVLPLGIAAGAVATSLKPKKRRR